MPFWKYMLATAALSTILMLPAAIPLIQDYLAFRQEITAWQDERDARESQINGVDIGLGDARVRITANFPELDGPEIWLDSTLSRKGCAQMTAFHFVDTPARYIKVACLDPESGTAIPALAPARIWPDRTHAHATDAHLVFAALARAERPLSGKMLEGGLTDQPTLALSSGG